MLGDVLYRTKGDLSGAEAAYAQSVGLNKWDSESVASLCLVRAAKGEVDLAIATGEQSLKENPRQPDLQRLVGDLYQQEGKWQKAQDAYQNVLSQNALDPFASNGLARVILRTGGNYDSALSLAQTAQRSLPESPFVFDTMGWIYYKKGVYPLAISNLQQALKISEKKRIADNPDIHYHLGLAYAKAGQPALARQHFEHVLKMYPNYPEAAEIRNELPQLKS
jgi:tetratricopeptide (TPR) repeat protein